MKVPIRVVVIDDHVLYRRGLEVVLAHEDDIVVVGEGGDGTQAVPLVRQTHPDVLLLDVRMPLCGGIEAARAVGEADPDVRIIMLTTSDDEADVIDSIRAGAKGYILKDGPAEEVVAGIRTVMSGGSLLSPSMTALLMREFQHLSQAGRDQRSDGPVPPADAGTPLPDGAANGRTSPLTSRELEVLRLIARGQANRDIATHLFISENTVKNHVRSILEKLGLRSRTEAAMYAVREGLVESP